MTKAIGYLRVSTDKQVESGVSLAAQREKVDAYASLYDIELLDVIEDAGVSASSLDRPGLSKARGALKDGEATALLVFKLDRLTRSVVDLGALIIASAKEGWDLMSVSENIDTRTAAGRLVLNVLGSVSQWEREAIGERTSVAMQHKKALGEYTGGAVPYGYKLADDGRMLEEDAAERQVMHQAYQLYGARLSYRRIGELLVQMGFRSRLGHAFAPMQVRRMVHAIGREEKRRAAA